jgi:formate dehydrogenase subunit gamma
MPETLAFDEGRAQRIIEVHQHVEGPLLPLLHAFNDEFGYVSEAAVPFIAAALNLSRAEVYGVVSFYHDFRREPAGRHVLKICRAEACQSMGCEKIARDLLAELAIDWHGTTPDGDLTVEPVYCLGLCACGPAALLDGQPLARLSLSKLDAARAEARKNAGTRKK